MKITIDDFCRWPIGFWQAIPATFLGTSSTDYGVFLRQLTGHKTVVETSLSLGAYCQFHTPMWMEAMNPLTHFLGEMLLKADYTPIILNTYQNTTHLNATYAYTVMHADVYLEVDM